MATKISIDDIQSGINSGLCKAWVIFRGKGTVSIDKSFNVSSITDVGTGTYRVNFTNTMSSALYCVTGGCSTDAVRYNGFVSSPPATDANFNATGFNFGALSFGSTDAGTLYDPISMHVAVFD